MCAQFMLKAKLEDLARKTRAKLPLEPLEIRPRVFPKLKAPVLVLYDGERVIREMLFSLIPAWSKEPKVKFATYNARLETQDQETGLLTAIYNKPTWKKPFLTQHCLVPMTSFFERSDHGKFSGNMIQFNTPGDDLLLAAGIWERWQSKTTGEIIDSFAILTDDPLDFVQEMGHDRSPVFLNDNNGEHWLNDNQETPQAMVDFLLKNKLKPKLACQIDRPLKQL